MERGAKPPSARPLNRAGRDVAGGGPAAAGSSIRPQRRGRARRRCPALLVAFVVGVLPATGCGRSPVPRDGARAPTNVILVSVDTLRADHLGAYGYPAPTSPRIDEFRAGSVLFRRAIAHAPSTLPSHASMLTSLLPQHHGASFAKRRPLPDAAVTLAEVLRDHGYRGGAFTGGGQLDPIFGLQQGFDTVKVIPGKHRFAQIASRALEWIEGGSGPFFLFMHTYDVHHPYTPPRWRLRLFERRYRGGLPREMSIPLLRDINSGRVPIDDADRRHIVALYDAEIHQVDEVFGVFVERLRELGLYDGSLLILTSDHGEELGEHGVVGWHGHTLYDELLRVPLIVKFPAARWAGIEVPDQVRSIDVAPTVLDVVGAEIPGVFAGRSVTEMLSDRCGAERIAVSLLDGRLPSDDVSAIRAPDWKLYGSRLFDLTADGGEEWDLALARRDVAARLADELAAQLGAREPLPPEDVEPIPEATVEELVALGYIE